MMKLLVIGIDQALRDPGSASAQRQRPYYEGWSVDVLVLAPGKAAEYELAPGIRIHLTGGASKLAAFYRGWKLGRQLVRAQQPEVVSVQDALWSGLLGYLVKGHAGLYIQDHSELFTERLKTQMERLFAPLSRWLARRAQHVRTVGLRGLEGLVSVGVERSRVVEIPVATPVAKYAGMPLPDMAAKTVLAIGRFEWQKGFDVLLRAWRLVLDHEPSARLRLVGDGSLSASLHTLSSELHLGDSVEFRGSGLEVSSELAWASMLVQPSRFEGWGLVMVEAAAAARPVIMTNVGCAGEVIIDGESGVIIPQENPQALAKAILDLFYDSARARRLGERARQIALALPSPEETVQRIRASIEAAKL